MDFDEIESGDEFLSENNSSLFLSKEDRLWRHPSEVGSSIAPAHHLGRSKRYTPYLVVFSVMAIGLGFFGYVTNIFGGNRGVSTAAFMKNVTTSSVLKISDQENVGILKPSLSPGFQRMVTNLMPSIVGIKASNSKGVSFATGVIVKSNGIILAPTTIGPGFSSFQVSFNDGTIQDAVLLGSDSGSGFSVLRVSKKGLSPAGFAPDGDGRTGEIAASICLPFGTKNASISIGSVDGVGVSAQTNSGSVLLDGIVTDASVSGCKDGAVLVDGAGNLLGIAVGILQNSFENQLLYASYFLAPVIVNDIVQSGKVDHGWIGIEGQDSGSSGVLISEVDSNGPAALAGVQVGDILINVNGQIIPNLESLQVYMYTLKSGVSVPITVIRQGKTMTLSIKLSS